MQSLATFFEDNKPLAYAAVVAAVIVLIFVVLVLYRLLFGRRLRAAANGRTRQPRLGIVDAYDLDRQRQLVLVRRDNVEHLIMIGGPTDVVIESTIVRSQPATGNRDKELAGPLVGAVTSPSGVTPASGMPAFPPMAASSAPPAGPSLPPGTTRTEPPLAAKSEPAAARGELSRAEPPFGPRAEPAPPRGEPSRAETVPASGDRPSPERAGARPVAAPDAAALQGDAGAQPPRPAPPRPPGPPARPFPASGPSPERPPLPRTPLPPRPPVTRPPLPPRPSLASSLPPRPARPQPTRPDIARPDASTSAAQEQPAAQNPVLDGEARAARVPEEPPRVAAPVGQPVGQPVRTIESLESLEDEMAKLLGRPAPRRDT